MLVNFQKSIRFLGMNDPHVDEGDDNVTYEDNMILHEKPQTKVISCKIHIIIIIIIIIILNAII